MSKVTKETREIQPAVPAVTEDVFVLRLDREEAEFIMRLVGQTPVGAGPRSMMDPRGTWDKLYDAIGKPQTEYGSAKFDVQVKS